MSDEGLQVWDYQHALSSSSMPTRHGQTIHAHAPSDCPPLQGFPTEVGCKVKGAKPLYGLDVRLLFCAGRLGSSTTAQPVLLQQLYVGEADVGS